MSRHYGIFTDLLVMFLDFYCKTKYLWICFLCGVNHFFRLLIFFSVTSVIPVNGWDLSFFIKPNAYKRFV